MCPPEGKQSTLDKEKQELERKGIDRAHPVLSSLKSSLSFLRCLSLLSCVGLNPQTVPPCPGVRQGEAGTPGVLQLKKLSRKSQGTSPNYSPSGRGCKLSPHEQMLKQGIRHQWMQGWVFRWQFAVSQGHAQVRLTCTQSEWIQHEGINHLEVDPWGTRCARLFQRQHIQGRQYITVVQMNASGFQCLLALHITATHLSPLLWFLVTKQLSD